MDDPWLFHDEHSHVEVACYWIVRPCMDAYVVFFLGGLETFRHHGDILCTGHTEVGFFLVGCLSLEEDH